MNDRLRILEMVKEGKVTPEEGASLLEELERGPRGASRTLRVRILTPAGQKTQFTIPISVASSVLSLIPPAARVSLEARGIRIDDLVRAIQEGEASGPLVDIKEPSGASLEVIVE